MLLAPLLKINPRTLAEKIIDLMNCSICEKIEVAGPGFINFYLSSSFLKNRLQVFLSTGTNLGIESIEKKEKVLVDFSGPNIAKEMHVGHLRSTIIGNCIANILDVVGYKVERINHVGDWGTQLAMVLAFIENQNFDKKDFNIDSLEDIYVKAKKLFDESEDFQLKSREILLKLQSNDKETLALWRVFRQKSLEHCKKIYKLLRVKIKTRGESFYRSQLSKIVEDILKNLPFHKDSGAKKTQGAIGVFFNKKEADELKINSEIPFLIQRSNGAFLYSTTDLAALKSRLDQGFKKIIYITDHRQRSHFSQVFHIIKKLVQLRVLSAPQNYELIHKGFGMVLGDNGKPFKTRDGGAIKLSQLLTQSKEKAYKLALKLSPHLKEKEKLFVAQEAGYGSVKYADLSHSISSDYKFNWNKMLNSDGNTAFYLLINYARTHSLERKMREQNSEFSYEKLLIEKKEFIFSRKEELLLAKQVIFFHDLWDDLVQELNPHLLLTYTYKLGQTFSSFWSSCPILKIEDEQLKYSRLMLVILVQKILKFSLDILQIKALKTL